jgi:hypothetical protein
MEPKSPINKPPYQFLRIAKKKRLAPLNANPAPTVPSLPFPPIHPSGRMSARSEQRMAFIRDYFELRVFVV